MLIRFSIVLGVAWFLLFNTLIGWRIGQTAEEIRTIAQIGIMPGLILVALAYAVRWAVTGRR